jgi:predicted dehydrogenase
VDGLVAMYEDFADAVTTGRRPLSTPEEALADLRLALAWLQAAETGRVVRVADMM